MNLRSLLAAALISGPVLAQVAAPPPGLPAVAFDAPALERQQQAVAALGAWIDSASKSGAAFPRSTDPGLAGQLFKAIFDKTTIAEAPADGGRLAAMCTVARAILTAYARQGVAADAIKPGQMPPKAIIDQMTANTVRYQAESQVIMDYTLDCNARIATMAAPAWAQMPPSQRADTNVAARLKGLQSDLLALYRGGVATVVDKTYGQPLRTSVLTAMNRDAAAFTSAWTTEQRAQLTADVDQALKTAEPAYAPGLTRLREAVSKAPCTGLCAT